MTDGETLGRLSETSRAPHAYESFVPSLFNFFSADPSLRKYIARELARTEQNCPAEGVWLVEGAEVLAGKYLLTSNDRFAPETTRDQPKAGLEALLRGASDGPRMNLRAAAGNADPIVLLMKAGAGNYGHIVAEMLPKLLTLKRLGMDRFNAIIPAEAKFAEAIITAASAAVGLHTNLVLVGDGLSHVDHLVIPSAVSQHNKRKSFTLVDLTNQLVDWAHATPTSGPADKLVVWRRSNEKRSPIGDAKLLDILQSNGYRVVFPADMSFQEQVATFSRAQLIVGMLGAGLTNMVFASPQTRIFMIDPGLFDFFFWDLACVRRQDFTWYFSEPIDFFDVEKLKRPSKIDVDDTIAALRRAGFI